MARPLVADEVTASRMDRSCEYAYQLRNVRGIHWCNLQEFLLNK